MRRISWTCSFSICRDKQIQNFKNILIEIYSGNCEASYTKNLYLLGIFGNGFLFCILKGTSLILALVLELMTDTIIKNAKIISREMTDRAIFAEF